MATVQLPTDGSGKHVRTIDRGGVLGHDQYVSAVSDRNNLGDYYAHGGLMTVQAAAHAATAGFLVLINRSVAQRVALRRITSRMTPTAVTVFPTAPRILLERITFTGTPTGTQITPLRRVQTAQNNVAIDATPVGEIRTALTGLTIAGNITFGHFLVAPVLIAIAAGAGPATVDSQIWTPREEKEELSFANGEGLLIRQADAGTAADTRRVVFDVEWEEYTKNT